MSILDSNDVNSTATVTVTVDSITYTKDYIKKVRDFYRTSSITRAARAYNIEPEVVYNLVQFYKQNKGEFLDGKKKRTEAEAE